MNKLEDIALKTRQLIFSTVVNNKAGHLASSLSSVEILTELYFDGILQYDPNDPEWQGRDRFVLSKGHSALGMYSTLALAGYYDVEELETFCIAGTRYGGLPLKGKVKGIECTSGSLGHGLSYAAGAAIAAKYKSERHKVYCMLGDGECQEGSIWEAAMFINQHKLNNLIIVIDNNGIQATGRTKNIIEVESLQEKWEAFGFNVISVNGHSFQELHKAFEQAKESPKSTVIIANTIKGKGLSFAEDMDDWHYKMPTEEQIIQGKLELGIKQ